MEDYSSRSRIKIKNYGSSSGNQMKDYDSGSRIKMENYRSGYVSVK